MRNKQVEFNPNIYTLSKLSRFGYEISVFEYTTGRYSEYPPPSVTPLTYFTMPKQSCQMCFGLGDNTGGGHIYEKVIIVLKADLIAQLYLLMQNKILKRPPSPPFFSCQIFFFGRLDLLAKVPGSAPDYYIYIKFSTCRMYVVAYYIVLVMRNECTMVNSKRIHILYYFYIEMHDPTIPIA